MKIKSIFHVILIIGIPIHIFSDFTLDGSPWSQALLFEERKLRYIQLDSDLENRLPHQINYDTVEKVIFNIILHTFRMTWAKHITSSWTEGKPMIYNENIYISNASIQILHEVLQFTIYQPDDFDLCFHGTFNAKWIKDHVFEKTIVSIKMCFESRSESLVEILLHNMFHLEIWMHHKRIHCQPLYHA